MKNTRLKKSLSNSHFVIASAGKTDNSSISVALHANLADNNSCQAITEHYNELISKGLVAENVALVVTDMLPVYGSVIKALFVNAKHQFCIFHLIQQVNKALKETLKQRGCHQIE
jgi:transposase-like protein